MAGTLVIDTLKSSTSNPPTVQNTSGTEIGTFCRAWVNFNGTGTVAIRASFNVSSITDLGTGYYTINFATAMPDVNFTTLGITGAYNIPVGGLNTTTTSYFEKTTSSVNVRTSTYDTVEVCIAIFR